MDRVHGTHQFHREVPLADSPLPAIRCENDIHVTDQRPDDVICCKLTWGISTGSPSLLIRNRGPDHKIDDRLCNHANHIKVICNAILKLLKDGDLHGGKVKVKITVHASSF